MIDQMNDKERWLLERLAWAFAVVVTAIGLVWLIFQGMFYLASIIGALGIILGTGLYGLGRVEASFPNARSSVTISVARTLLTLGPLLALQKGTPEIHGTLGDGNLMILVVMIYGWACYVIGRLEAFALIERKAQRSTTTS